MSPAPGVSDPLSDRRPSGSDRPVVCPQRNGYGRHMPLVADIGNTRTKLGLFHMGGLKRNMTLTDIRKDVIEGLVGSDDIEAVVISSVVPSSTRRLIDALRELTPLSPLLITHTSDTGLTLAVEHPQRLGTDRIVVAAYAWHYFGAAVAVVDLGTVTTLSVVDNGGRFLGGALIPGVGMMLDSLNQRTALLPHVGAEALAELAKDLLPIGNNTHKAIASGTILATVGAIRHIIGEAQISLGYSVKTVLTGGNCPLVVPFLNGPDLVDSNLSLKGLNYIYERTQ
ncbi:Bordetella pertussis Bvg accessory factor [Candidatus Magnetobacterium bavaricum]|uniref:Type III pantothenate kinase n=1 Tax=Candidatus Magnetobacterium bavaricum TaxID=29290 RepID=A0A0F3GNT4_9BACT|nr:Bordetella pertussis Bvg accessory factor [Candidatus Magnetobacterium bavaricum]